MPPCPFDAPAVFSIADKQSPKSVALPVEAIVITSIVLVLLPAIAPAAKIPLVWLEVPAGVDLATVKSPKSEALPVEAIVIYWIILLSRR